MLFLDNKEEKNLTKLNDWLLFVATGAERERADRSGSLRQHSSGRPVVLLTSIEGLSALVELTRRNVEFEFVKLSDDQVGNFSEKDNKREILAARDKMMSGVMRVLQKFMSDEDAYPVTTPPAAVRDFGDNWRTVCKLLRAYADVTGKPAGWAEGIIAPWNRVLDGVAVGINEELTVLVRAFLHSMRDRVEWLKLEDFMGSPQKKKRIALSDIRAVEITVDGRSGVLYITHAHAIARWADDHSYPCPHPNVLSARLHEAESADLKILREKDVPENSELSALLKRESNVRLLGLFVLEDKK